MMQKNQQPVATRGGTGACCHSCESEMTMTRAVAAVTEPLPLNGNTMTLMNTATIDCGCDYEFNNDKNDDVDRRGNLMYYLGMVWYSTKALTILLT
jgi:hypothetical protein